MSWNKYYKEWTEADYKRHIRAQHGFIHRCQDNMRDAGKVLECGIGSGQISIYLAEKGYHVIGIDNDEKILDNADKVARKSLGYKASYFFILADILGLPIVFRKKTFDMVLSQGVLEHFEDKLVSHILKSMAQIGRRVAFSVPLDKFGHQSYGDERLMPKEYWLEKCKDYNVLFSNTFAGDKQFMCIFEEKNDGQQ
jgi:SAM-dependent methyltransferase